MGTGSVFLAISASAPAIRIVAFRMLAVGAAFMVRSATEGGDSLGREDTPAN